MRTHIAKSLQTRCKAIQNAVAAYNSAALLMRPPRPTLDWSKASHYSFLEDFQLLQDTRNDIREKPWATPVIRAVMKQFQRIQRAHEEIDNCHIEIRRLHTHVLDETADLGKIAQELAVQHDPIAGPVADYALRRVTANNYLHSRIMQIYHMESYSGDKTPGRRIGRTVASGDGPSTQVLPVHNDGDDDIDYELEEDDDLQDEYGGLVNFVSDMHL